jgi:hypothetical protein
MDRSKKSIALVDGLGFELAMTSIADGWFLAVLAVAS